MIEDFTFLYWSTEREEIRKKRARGLPAPWTRDPVLQNYRFCNVSREHDRVTIWIKDNIRDYFDREAEDLDLFHALCLARFINLPSTLASLLQTGVLSPGYIYWGDIIEVVEDLQRSGRTTFSNAYMVRSETGMSKIRYIVSSIQQIREIPPTSSREAFTKSLSKHYGFGEFMAGQVAADAARTRLLRHAPDHLTWAPLGPGAIRGMNRSLGRPIGAGIRESEYLEVGRLQLNLLQKELPDLELELHDVASNVNCETDKYLRARNHEHGRLRSYAGHR